MGCERKITAELADKIQKDRDAGMTVKQLKEKYKLSEATISNFTESKRDVGKVLKKPWEKAVTESIRSWPEWREWDALHERYGKGSRRQKERP